MAEFILSAFGDEIAEDLKTQMDVLERHGIRHIEMRGVNGKPVVRHTLYEARQIKKELDRRGFRVSAIGSPIGKIGILDPFDDHLALFRHTLQLAIILDTTYIRMFSFYIPEVEDPDRYRGEVLSRWRAFIDAASGTDVILLHENEKGIYGDTPERCLDLIESLNCDCVSAVFDPANFVQCGCAPYPNAFETLKGHITYLHIKDALFADGSVVPAGKGDGRIRDILLRLKQMNYQGFLSLEPHLVDFIGFSALEKGAADKGRVLDAMQAFDLAVGSLMDLLVEIDNR